MKAVVYEGKGGPEVIVTRELPMPVCTPDSLLVKVHASALNRGDVLQREGEYDIPAGQSTIPGIEIAGTVEAWGENVRGFTEGQRVYGVVEGGGFAEFCLLDRGMANLIPETIGFEEAAATAESFLTCNETLFELGGLAPGDHVLIHAGASAIGTTAMRMTLHAGARPICTVGSPRKAEALHAFGASAVIEYKTQDFLAEVLRLTGGEGVPLVLDFVGGAYLERNLRALRLGGCLVVAGLLDGLSAEIDLLLVVERRLRIKGSSLRLRPMREKREVNKRFRSRWIEPLERGEIRPVIYATHPIAEVAQAQHLMESHQNIGKIVIAVRDANGRMLL
ncbi:NAD(P)H-quinone oxidoreductase [Dyella subtropica]|uniref:NAD(P)H-quinone oxidoreductase n=1 Tax=Dyella subtropica TaxID=2992127 RepID=UPI00225179B9|nr:NAD(P)H-quinone oxidoreductase [Dyella subtropica]